MKLIYEDSNDAILKNLEKRYLEPDEYDEPSKFYALIDVEIYDEVTGDTNNVKIEDYEISKDYIETKEDAEKYIEENLEDIIFDTIDKDERFDNYETFDNINIIINDIVVEEHQSDWFATESINEAFGDKMLQDLRDYIEDELDAKFESNLAMKAASRVKQYNPDFAADTESNDLKKAREAYIDAIMFDLISNG